MMDEKQELEMLRRFVAEKGHPLEFAVFKAKWIEEHSEPVATGQLLTENPSPITEETASPDVPVKPKRPRIRVDADV